MLLSYKLQDGLKSSIIINYGFAQSFLELYTPHLGVVNILVGENLMAKVRQDVCPGQAQAQFMACYNWNMLLYV